MAYEMRKAASADRSGVEAVVDAAYSPWIARIGRKPGPMLDDYGALIRDGWVHVLVDRGLVQGVLVLRPEQDAMVLDNIAVAPVAQGRGYGRIMLEFAEQAAHAAGLPVIRLYTNAAMTENVSLYLRHGYAETHRAVEKGFRRVYMTKSLVSHPEIVDDGRDQN